MDIRRDLLNKLFEETKGSKTKIGRKVYNWLNHDNLGEILTDGEYYFTEKTYSGAVFPDYAYDYIENFMKRHGFNNPYNIK